MVTTHILRAPHKWLIFIKGFAHINFIAVKSEDWGLSNMHAYLHTCVYMRMQTT